MAVPSTSAVGYTEELLEIDDELKTVDQQLAELKTRRRKLFERKTQITRAVKQRGDDASTVTSWEGESFPWSTQLKEARSGIFKMPMFREHQLTTMNALLSGEDVILIMSTGGGKSLCYQLPAAISTGITLVISPLLSLIEDQSMALEHFGVPAESLNASTPRETVNKILAGMTDSKCPYRLLFVTPEKVAKSKRFMNKLEKMREAGRFDRIAIDEVHCCSQWGHDFRPDYKFLNVLKRQFPKVPIIGLTATATSRVIDDVKSMLNIPGALVFRASFNRPNLFYEVRHKPAGAAAVVADMAGLITNRFAKQSGIIYCFSRKESEELTRGLRSKGIKAGCYHADIPLEQRSNTHRKWTANINQVVVATVAFGMGIDKPDVRFVLHHSLPKSMENYYQESGRAGRDGKPAYCILYYRYADVFRQSTMICTEKQGPENLYGLLAYCIDEQFCRRQLVARHFGESWKPDWCKEMCDHCSSTRNLVQVDIAKAAKQIFAILHGLKDRVTGPKLIELWKKSGGKGSALPIHDAEQIVAHLLLEGYLREDYHFTPYNIISYVVPGFKANILAQKTDHSVSIVCLNGSTLSSVGTRISQIGREANSSIAEATDEWIGRSGESTTKRMKMGPTVKKNDTSAVDNCVVLD